MNDDDFCLSPYWCPLCGDPRAVCDSYGGCGQSPNELELDFDEMEGEEDASQ